MNHSFKTFSVVTMSTIASLSTSAGERGKHLQYIVRERMTEPIRTKGAAEYSAALVLLGEGKSRNPAEGMAKLQAASDVGFPPAMYVLAIRTLRGEDTPLDPEKGIQLLVQSAVKAYPQALFTLGRLLEAGNGVSKSPWLALACYQVAQQSELKEVREPLTRLSKQLESHLPSEGIRILDLQQVELIKPYPAKDLPPGVENFGLVIMEVDVGPDGVPRRLAKALGTPEVEKIAAPIMEAARFKPWINEGQPSSFRVYWALRVTHILTTDFVLEVPRPVRR